MVARSSLNLKHSSEPLARAVASLAAVAVAAALLVADDASAQMQAQPVQPTLGTLAAGGEIIIAARFVGQDYNPDANTIFGHSCGLRTGGTITCWGSNIAGEADAPSGSFSAVTAGGSHSCGLRTDATVTCWGLNRYGQTDAPGGSFSAVTAGASHSCGLRTDATVTCWGDNEYGEADAPSGSFSAVSAGAYYSCGLRTDATVTCWGLNGAGEADAPSGSFSAVSAGRSHSCGLRTDATVTCWGWNEYGEADAPSGSFSAVSAGRRYSCGLRTDATVTCWGWNEYGQADAPSGSFSAVSASGAGHSCGLRTDATVTCWGDNSFGQADAPSGQFGLQTEEKPLEITNGTISSRTAGTSPEPAREGVPGVVRNLIATPLPGGGVLVDWSASSDGSSAIVRYEVTYSRDAMYYRGRSRDAWHITKQVRATPVFFEPLRIYREDLATSHMNMRLYSGVGYTVSVTAVNSIGSGQSATAEFRTFDVPDVPRGLEVTPLQNGGVEVSWSAPSDGGSPILHYEVEYSRSALHDHDEYGSRDEWYLTRTVRDGTSHVLAPLLVGVSYVVSVTAVNRVGSSHSTVPRVFVTRQPCPTVNKFETKKESKWKLWKLGRRSTWVVALQDFVTIHDIKIEAGERGGKVSDESNLSQSGCSWIFEDAEVSDDARVSGNAVVSGGAKVYDDSRVYGDARVHGDARVYDDAAVYGDAAVFGDARIYGSARVHGNARVHGESEVYGRAELFGSAEFPGLNADTELFGTAELPGLVADAGQFDGVQEHERSGQELYRAMRAHFTDRLIECDRPLHEYKGNDIPTIVDSLLNKDRNNEIRPVSEALLIVCKEVIGLREVTGFFLPTWWDLIFPMAVNLTALRGSFYLKSLIELAQIAKPLRDLSQIPNAASMWEEFNKCDSRSC